MPIDPSIPLSVRPFQGVNLQAIQEGRLRQLQEQRLQQAQDFEREKYGFEKQQFLNQQAAQKAVGEALATGGDREAIKQRLIASGQADKWLYVSEQLDKFDESTLKNQAMKDAMEARSDEAVARLGGAVNAMGNQPWAWDFLKQEALSGGHVKPEQLAPFDQAIAQDPSKIADITKAMMLKTHAKPEYREIPAGGGLGIVSGPGAGTIVASQPARPTAPTMASLRLQAAQGDPDALAAVQMAEKEKQVSEAKVGSFEDYVLRAAAEKGKKPEQLTTAEIENARKRYQQADDRPLRSADEALVKVEHKDPATGRTVIQYLPKSEIRGKTFEKGTSATTETRLASAQAVNQTGNDIISKLSDPNYAKAVGPVMGRFSTVQDFIGNPPPEYAELAGQIESFALANMGVHGMRSAQGAEQIKKLLNQHHTPASLIAAIKGLNSFSEHFMQNEGRGAAVPAPATAPASAAPSGTIKSYQDYLKSRGK